MSWRDEQHKRWDKPTTTKHEHQNISFLCQTTWVKSNSFQKGCFKMLTCIFNSTEVSLEISTAVCAAPKRWIFIFACRAELATHWNINIHTTLKYSECLYYANFKLLIDALFNTWNFSDMCSFFHIRWVYGDTMNTLLVWLPTGIRHIHNCIPELEA